MDPRSRVELIQQAMAHTNWDLLACGMPANVLLLSGYWPGLGQSLAIATRSAQIYLIAPQDEEDLADRSWVDGLITYIPTPLDRMVTAEESLYDALIALKRQSGLTPDRIGFEQAGAFEPAGFSPHLFRGSAASILRRAFPSATLAPADEMLAQLRTTKTPAEINHIRNACRVAERGFRDGARMLRAGLTECQVAAAFRLALTSCTSDGSVNQQEARRCDGFLYCASGENSTAASGPFGRSRTRPVGEGDLVICRAHCYSDGYWADVARTYHLGPLDAGKRRMFDAIFAARDAALAAIQPGVSASRVDAIARRSLESHGFEAEFLHPAGHGAGFSAMDYAARPRLHPKSEDVLEPGMVLKLEPGVYVEGVGGVRVADMVAVTGNGPEVLTPFHWDVGQIEIRKEEKVNAL